MTGKGSEVAPLKQTALHVLMEGGNDCQEFGKTPNPLQDLEEPTSAHQVEGFGEVHKGGEQWLLLLSTLVLQLSEGGDHGHCGPPSSEATL